MNPAPSFTAQVHRLAGDAPRLLDRLLRTGGWYADLFYEYTAHHRLRLRQQARHPPIHLPFPVQDSRGLVGLRPRVVAWQRTVGQR